MKLARLCYGSPRGSFNYGVQMAADLGGRGAGKGQGRARGRGGARRVPGGHPQRN